LLVSFGDEVSLDLHRNVLRLSRLLDAAPELLNIHPAYASLLVTFDPRRIAHTKVESLLRSALERLDSVELGQPRTVEVPVRYGGEEGPDLEEIARLHCISPEEVVRIHSSADYLVYFLGFSPGFPYLGGMPKSIAAPKLAVPRRYTTAGSVAIGGENTGIYPVPSPGGWRVIGRTPLRIFEPERAPITLIQMGDHVRFVPI
jgi:KipI family sensor histidine kinase inhibitor